MRKLIDDLYSRVYYRVPEPVFFVMEMIALVFIITFRIITIVVVLILGAIPFFIWMSREEAKKPRPADPGSPFMVKLGLVCFGIGLILATLFALLSLDVLNFFGPYYTKGVAGASAVIGISGLAYIGFGWPDKGNQVSADEGELARSA